MQLNHASSNTAELMWQKYENLVAEAFDQRHYSKASSLMKEALTKACMYGTAIPDLLARADELADFHLRQGDFQNAASIYRLSAELRTDALGDEHPEAERARQLFLQALNDAGSMTPITLYEAGKTRTA